VLNGAVPQPILNCPRVMPCIGEGVAAGVPQHVDVHLERETRAYAYALDQAIDGIGCEGSAALSLKHIATASLALQLAKRPQLVAADWMRCRLAILGAPNVQSGRAIELNLAPFQVANLDGAQPVPVGTPISRSCRSW